MYALSCSVTDRAGPADITIDYKIMTCCQTVAYMQNDSHYPLMYDYCKNLCNTNCNYCRIYNNVNNV